MSRPGKGMGSGTTVVLCGMAGQLPFAGVVWQTLHYLEGLRRLGFDVYYLEDTEEWPYDPEANTITDDPSYTVRTLRDLMDRVGLGGRWAYRCSADNAVYGLPSGRLADVLRGADILINLAGATVLRDEHRTVPIRLYLETDPVLPQIEVAQGNQFTIDLMAAHTHHASFGENLGQRGCGVPVGPFRYIPTRQPVVLDWWAPPVDLPATPGPHCFTTIANWRQTAKDVTWNGETYRWSKHLEFLKVLDLPQRSGCAVELALATDDQDALDLLRVYGWRVSDAVALSRSIEPYRGYILNSRGEFTVAKDQNIRLQSGWFSDRSACYLAAGRPVITQDTGFARTLPTGDGLFSFRTLEDILAALAGINAGYRHHREAARALAETYFRAETVLQALLDAVTAPSHSLAALP